VIRRRGVPIAVLLGLACGLIADLTSSPVLGAARSISSPRVVASLGSPRCTTALAAAPSLTGIPTASALLPGYDATAVVARGRWSFVSMPGRGIEVLSDRSFPPRPVRMIGSAELSPAGETITHDGRYLLAASRTGAAVFSLVAAARPGTRPYLGTLSSGRTVGSAVKVVVSPDDRFVFVSLESANEIAVFDLRRALADHFGRSGLLGTIPLGTGPVGMAISPNGRWLYATSEVARGWGGREPQQGSLSVIDLRRAETQPSKSLVRSVTAGCRPVRMALSRDGRIIWVTARESNALLAFSAPKLIRDPGHALIADVPVGQAPTDVVLVDHSRRLVVTDSNRHPTGHSQAELSIVDPKAALAGRPALIGTLPAQVAHEEGLEPNGATLLIPEFNHLVAINTSYLP
jgi:hypothetical protein